jgi:hypothetical protein
MFPLSINGKVLPCPNKEITTNIAREKIAADLRSQNSTLERTSEGLRFSNSWWSQLSWFRYSVVGQGTFTIAPSAISYHLSTKAFAITTSLISLGFALLLIPNRRWSAPENAAACIGLWLFLTGGNYLILSVRNCLFLRRVVAEASL